jgi:hypothetical protein
MKALLQGLLVAVAVASATTFSTTGVAQQVCDDAAGARSSPDARFEDHADGTVTDKESKLMWARCALGQTWAGGRCMGDAVRQSVSAARASVGAINQRGDMFFSDWRLPQLAELATLVERHCVQPRLNSTVFPDTPGDWFWTATARPGSNGNAGSDAPVYALSFGEGSVAFHTPDEAHHLRLVRRAGP